MGTREYPQVRVRLPPEINSWLERQAGENYRSKSGEISYRLQQAKAAQEKPEAGSFRALIRSQHHPPRAEGIP